MKIEAESKELVLRNESGDVIIIPKDKRQEALSYLNDGKHTSIDDMAVKLPRMKNYAEEGTVIPDGELTLKERIEKARAEEGLSLKEKIEKARAEEIKKKNGTTDSEETKDVSENIPTTESTPTPVNDELANADFGSFLPEQEQAQQSSTDVVGNVQEAPLTEQEIADKQFGQEATKQLGKATMESQGVKELETEPQNYKAQQRRQIETSKFHAEGLKEANEKLIQTQEALQAVEGTNYRHQAETLKKEVENINGVIDHIKEEESKNLEAQINNINLQLDNGNLTPTQANELIIKQSELKKNKELIDKGEANVLDAIGQGFVQGMNEVAQTVDGALAVVGDAITENVKMKFGVEDKEKSIKDLFKNSKDRDGEKSFLRKYYIDKLESDLEGAAVTNNMLTETVKQATSILTEFGLAGELGVGMAGVMIGGGSLKEYGEAKDRGEDVNSRIASGFEGAKEGAIETAKLYLMGGISGKIAGKITKNAFGQNAISGTLVAGMFGGDTYIQTGGDMEAVSKSVALGLALGGSGLIKQSATKAVTTYNSVSEKALTMARETKQPSDEMILEGSKQVEQGIKENDSQKVIEGNILVNMGTAKAFDEYAAKNPTKAKELISNLDLSVREQENLNSKIDKSVAENMSEEAKKLGTEIDELEAKKEDIKNNEHLSEGIKKVQEKAINEEQKLKEEALADELGREKPQDKDYFKEQEDGTYAKEENTTPTTKTKIIKTDNEFSIEKESDRTTAKPTKEKPFIGKTEKGSPSSVKMHINDNGVLTLTGKKGNSVEIMGTKKEFFDKDGNYYKKLKVKQKNGKYKTATYLMDKNTHKVIKEVEPTKIDDKTINPILEQYVEKATLQNGKYSKFENESADEYDRKISEQSENPIEVVEAIIRRDKDNNFGKNTSHYDRISNVITSLGKISRESWRRFGDINDLKGDKKHFDEAAQLKQSYIRDNKPGERHNDIDTVVIDHDGKEYSTQELVDIIRRYPEGITSLNKEVADHTSLKLKQRFEELTGIPLTEKILDKVIEKSIKDEIGQKEHDFMLAIEGKDAKAYEEHIRTELEKENLIINEKGEIKDVDKRTEKQNNSESTNGEKTKESKPSKEIYNERTAKELEPYKDKLTENKEKQKEILDRMAENTFDFLDSIGGVSKAVGDKKKSSSKAVVNIAVDLAKLTGLKGEELVLKLKEHLYKISKADDKLKRSIDIAIDSSVKAIENATKDLTPTSEIKETQSIKTQKIAGLQKEYSKLKIELDGITKGGKGKEQHIAKKKEIVDAYLKFHEKEIKNLAGKKAYDLTRALNKAVTEKQISDVVDRIQRVATNQEHRDILRETTEGLKEIVKQSGIFKGQDKLKEAKKENTEAGIQEAYLLREINRAAKAELKGVAIEKLNDKRLKEYNQGQENVARREELNTKSELDKTESKELAELNELDEFGLTKTQRKRFDKDALLEYDGLKEIDDLLSKGDEAKKNASEKELKELTEQGLTPEQDAKLISLQMITDFGKLSSKEKEVVVNDVKLAIKNRAKRIKQQRIEEKKIEKEQRDELRNNLYKVNTRSEQRKELKSKLKDDLKLLKDDYESGKIEKSDYEVGVKKLNQQYKKDRKNVVSYKKLENKKITQISENAKDIKRRYLFDWGVDMRNFRSLMSSLSGNTLKNETGTYRDKINNQVYPKVKKASRGQTQDRKDLTKELNDKTLEIFGDKGGNKLENYFINSVKVMNLLKDGSYNKDVLLKVKNRAGETVTKRITQADAATYYNLLKSVENNKDFFTSQEKGGMGWDTKTVEKLNEKLDPRWKELADWQFDKYNNELYNKRNKTYRKIEGVDLFKEENYSPKSGKRKSSEDVEMGVTATSENVRSNANIERIKTPVVIEPKSLLDGYVEHINDLTHYTNYAEVVKDLNNLFLNQKTKEIIAKNFGTAYNNNIKRYIERFSGDVTTENLAIMNAATRMFTKGALYLNKGVGLKQMISINMFLTEMSPVDAARYTSYLATHPKQAKEIYNLLSGETFASSRGEAMLDIDIAKSNPFEGLGNQGLLSEASHKLGKVGNAIHTKDIDRLASANIRIFDKVPIMFGGSAFLLKRMKTNGKTYESATKEAEKLAEKENITKDEALRKVLSKELEDWDSLSSATQQSSFIEDVSNFKADNPKLRPLLSFTSGPSQLNYIAASGYRDMRVGVKLGDRKRAMDGLRKVTISHMLVPALYQIISNGGNIDWDKIKDAMLLGNTQGIPVLGKLIKQVADIYMDSPFGDSQMAPIWDAVIKTTKISNQVSKLKDKLNESGAKKRDINKRIDKLQTKMYLNMSALLGIPAKQVKKNMDDIASFMNEVDKKDPDYLIALKMLIGLDSKYNSGYDIVRGKQVGKKESSSKRR